MLKRLKPLGAVAVIVLAWHASTRAQDCQNQLAIDACLAGCSATEDVCGFVCGGAETACLAACDVIFGTCDFGCNACDLGCDVCCATTCFPGSCGNCRSSCTDCHDGCDSAKSSCRSVCQLDCDNCVLDCQAGCPTCKPFRTIGETCIAAINRCADGLACWPALFSESSALFQCFPEEALDLSDDDICRSMYSAGLHDDAISSDLALSYGTGAAGSVGVTGSYESGTVYDPDGCYGCYVTTCIGGETNLEINVYAALGQYDFFDDFAGESLVEFGSAGVAIVSLVVGQVFTRDTTRVIGAVEALALGPSLVPITFGVYSCNTTVDVVGCLDNRGNLVETTNNAPIANCADVSTCVDGETGLAGVDVDNGSSDPDGDAVTLTQSPPGPYAPGTHFVTLEARDEDGLTGICEAEVTVSENCSTPNLCGAGLGTILLMLLGLRWTGSKRRRPVPRP